jgi:protein O-mannosyl-transferase
VSQSSRIRDHLPALGALAAGVCAVHASSLRTGLVLDARVLVAENPVLRRVTAANLGFILTHDYWQPMSTDGLYRPITILSYLFNYTVLGNADRPLGYHVVNLLLHVACVGLVYALVWHLVRRRWPAVVAAALFGLHPVTTEAVTYVVGRADLLAATGVLGGLLCHARAAASAGRRRVAWSAGLLLAAVLAFFSKESGLVLVPITLGYDLIFPTPSRRDHVITLSVLAVYLAVRWYVARIGLPPEDTSPVDNPIVEASFWTGRLTAAKVMGEQLWLLLWPASLSADYSYRQIPLVAWPPARAADWAALLALPAFGVVAGAILSVRRRLPAVAFLAAFSALALLPTANLLVVVGSIRADRFLYLPLAGFAGVAAVIADRARARRAASALVALVLVAYAWRTWTRNRDWVDEPSVWSSAVRASPESAKAHKGWAAAMFAADPRRAALDRVIAAGERAVAIRPDYLPALIDLGGYYIARGDGEAGSGASTWYAKGVDVLERARDLDARAAGRFVAKMLASGARTASIPAYGNDTLYANLALAYLQLGRLDDALAAYEHCRNLDPGNPTRYVDLSAVLARLGRWDDASIALFEAVTIDGGQQDAARRLVELYRQIDPDGHAVVSDDAGGARINVDDPLVRRHRCQALAGLARIHDDARQHAAALRFRELERRFCDR